MQFLQKKIPEKPNIDNFRPLLITTTPIFFGAEGLASTRHPEKRLPGRPPFRPGGRKQTAPTRSGDAATFLGDMGRMNSTLKTECGRPVLLIEYDPELLNWDEAIRAGLAAHGFPVGQIKVIASPKRQNQGLQLEIRLEAH